VRLQHVSIPIASGGEERARAFYGGLLGLEERSVPPHLDPSRLIWFRIGEPDLELHLMIGTTPPEGAQHFCLELPELEALRARLEEAGVETRDPTEIVGRPRFFCRDPSGNLVELSRIDDPSV
jgi:catechol 2,3-dioxygenase-like lactoylglutathione lyase family enzyme